MNLNNLSRRAWRVLPPRLAPTAVPRDPFSEGIMVAIGGFWGFALGGVLLGFGAVVGVIKQKPCVALFLQAHECPREGLCGLWRISSARVVRWRACSVISCIFFGFGWVFGNLGAILGSSTYRVSGRVSLFAAEAGSVRSFLAAHRVRSNDASNDLGAKGSGESCSKGGRFPCKA